MPAKLYTIAERPAVRRRILESYSQLSEDDLSAVFPFAQAPL